jgi:hypothetical protein
VAVVKVQDLCSAYSTTTLTLRIFEGVRVFLLKSSGQLSVFDIARLAVPVDSIRLLASMFIVVVIR